MIILTKLEAENRMRDPWRAPVCDEEIQTIKLSKRFRLCEPFAPVVEFRFVRAIPEVVNRHFIAGNLGQGVSASSTCHVRLLEGLRESQQASTSKKSRHANAHNTNRPLGKISQHHDC